MRVRSRACSRFGTGCELRGTKRRQAAALHRGRGSTSNRPPKAVRPRIADTHKKRRRTKVVPRRFPWILSSTRRVFGFVAQTFKSAVARASKPAATGYSTIRRFGNRRHSRLGNLRYGGRIPLKTSRKQISMAGLPNITGAIKRPGSAGSFLPSGARTRWQELPPLARRPLAKACNSRLSPGWHVGC